MPTNGWCSSVARPRAMIGSQTLSWSLERDDMTEIRFGLDERRHIVTRITTGHAIVEFQFVAVLISDIR